MLWIGINIALVNVTSFPEYKKKKIKTKEYKVATKPNIQILI